MKIAVISGNPANQETLIMQLLKTATEEGQVVYLHNGLHAEMQILNKIEPMTTVNSDYMKFYNDYYGVCLSNIYKYAFTGHTVGFSYNLLSNTSKQKLINLIESVPTGGNSDTYWGLLRSTKDVKYIDLLIIYNVIDINNMLTALQKYASNYGSKDKIYWLNDSSNKIFSKLFTESFEKELNTIVYIDNIIMPDINSASDYVSKIVSGETIVEASKNIETEDNMAEEISVHTTDTPDIHHTPLLYEYRARAFSVQGL